MTMNAIAIAIGAGARPTPFLPSNLANLAAWFRFGVGITQAANAVSQWADQSGNGRHLKQATGAAQPIVQGDNTILFDGAAQFMKCDPFTLNQPFTVYLQVKQVSFTNTDRIVDGGSPDITLIQQRVASPQVFLSAGVVSSANSNLAIGNYGALAGVFNGASSVSQVDATASVTSDAGANNAAGFTLGANNGGGGPANIQVKEVIVYSVAHDAATRAVVNAYLNTL